MIPPSSSASWAVAVTLVVAGLSTGVGCSSASHASTGAGGHTGVASSSGASDASVTSSSSGSSTGGSGAGGEGTTAVSSTGLAASSASSASASSSGSTDGGATRDPALWPFASSSPWNMPLATTATYEAATATKTAAIRATASRSYVNRSAYAFPVYLAASTDPTGKITCATCDVGGTFTSNGSVSFPVPAAAAASSGTDSSIVIVTPDHDTAWESWQWSGTSPDYHTSYTVEQDLLGVGWGAGIHAAGCSLMGGLIRGWELATSPPVIPHTIAVGIATTAAASPQVWPAVAEDGNGSSYSGSIPMGTLLALDPTADVDTVAKTAEGRALGHALQDYGAYVIDTAGTTPGVGFVMDPLSTTAQQASDIGSDLGALVAKLAVITNNAPATPGGGGAGAQRRAAMAPPL